VTVILSSRDKAKSTSASGTSTPDEGKRKAEEVRAAKTARSEKYQGKAKAMRRTPDKLEASDNQDKAGNEGQPRTLAESAESDETTAGHEEILPRSRAEGP